MFRCSSQSCPIGRIPEKKSLSTRRPTILNHGSVAPCLAHFRPCGPGSILRCYLQGFHSMFATTTPSRARRSRRRTTNLQRGITVCVHHISCFSWRSILPAQRGRLIQPSRYHFEVGVGKHDLRARNGAYSSRPRGFNNRRSHESCGHRHSKALRGRSGRTPSVVMSALHYSCHVHSVDFDGSNYIARNIGPDLVCSASSNDSGSNAGIPQKEDRAHRFTNKRNHVYATRHSSHETQPLRR